MVKPLRSLSLRFFKVFLPDQSSLRMKFPPAFRNYFDGILPYKSTIVSPAKQSWRVDLEKVSGNLYFHKGWEQFVQDNSLEYGDFLVFCYGGNARFNVKIYGRNGCEKEVTYPTGESCRVISLPQENLTVERRDSQVLEDEWISKPIKREKLCPTASKSILKDVGALEEANKFKSEFPFFKILLRPSYVTGRGLTSIPTSFAKRCLKKNITSARILSSDKLWPVTIVKSEGSVRKFSTGWRVFSRDNALKTGDVCVFELIERNDYVLKASIFRCLD